MARGRKTGGRQKGARNRATEEARAAAAASGIMPLDFMLAVMRDLTPTISAATPWQWPLPLTFTRD
jgi:hypothetical protein